MRPEIEHAIEGLRGGKSAYLEVTDVVKRCTGFASDGRFHALLTGAQVEPGHIVVVTTVGVHEISDEYADYTDPETLTALSKELGGTIMALSPIGKPEFI